MVIDVDCRHDRVSHREENRPWTTAAACRLRRQIVADPRRCSSPSRLSILHLRRRSRASDVRRASTESFPPASSRNSRQRSAFGCYRRGSPRILYCRGDIDGSGRISTKFSDEHHPETTRNGFDERRPAVLGYRRIVAGCRHHVSNHQHPSGDLRRNGRAVFAARCTSDCHRPRLRPWLRLRFDFDSTAVRLPIKGH